VRRKRSAADLCQSRDGKIAALQQRLSGCNCHADATNQL
jgi:hypothetical protein